MPKTAFLYFLSGSRGLEHSKRRVTGITARLLANKEDVEPMEEVRCPKCNSLMVERTRRKRPRAGSKFYGCSRYPHCKQTRPIDSTVNGPLVDGQEQVETKIAFSGTVFPRSLVARANSPDHQVRFFEAAALPEDLMKSLNSDKIGERIKRAFSQWRLDFSVEGGQFTLNQRQGQVVGVLEKILTRGRITLLSPKLEKKLQSLFLKTPNGKPSLSVIEVLALQGYRRKQSLLWLDSEEESLFYKNILPGLLGRNYEQFIFPQIEMSSLLSPGVASAEYERVDFGIFHPLLDERIIVEIDGEQHKQHADADAERDKILQECGYGVIRIQANEIREGNGEGLSLLESKLCPIKEKASEDTSSFKKNTLHFIHAVKLVHQIQVVLLQAIQSGFLSLEDVDSWHIASDLDELGLFSRKMSRSILERSIADFCDLLRRLGRLYSLRIGQAAKCSLLSDHVTPNSGSTIHISLSDKHGSDEATFSVRNIYFPFHIAHSSFPASALVAGSLKEPREKDLQYFLQYLFRFSSFRERQYEGIVRALQGKDTLLLLPTGAGKSLVYQLASLLLPGRTVVIGPLISLMEDQIDNLAMLGIDRCVSITSQMTDPLDKSRAIALFGQGEYLFAYVAPERFQNSEFRDSLRTLTVHSPIALIVVDETHCVSEWGHDFRTAYLNIGRTSRIYCESNGNIPPLLGLTGTASRAVLKDVQRELQITEFDAVITPQSFDRPELKFSIIHSTSQEKMARLTGYLGQKLPSLFGITSSTLQQTRGEKTYSGLIFCPWINGEFGIERVSNEIRQQLSIHNEMYSGGPPKGWDKTQYDQHKRRVAKAFKRNRLPLLVCTKAFGMGIDKPNIRYTIHFNIPPSVEAFYQEVGRAGRDGNPSHCCMIISIDDSDRCRRLLDPETRIEEVAEILRKTSREENDDVTRNLYFHTKAFRGIGKEEEDVDDILEGLGDLSRKRELVLKVPDNIIARAKIIARSTKSDQTRQIARQMSEKALHRLLLIGIVSDYMIDYNSNEFTVRLSGADKDEIVRTYGEYVGKYNYERGEEEARKASQLVHLPMPEFVKAMLYLLLRFIYEVIELGRRRALETMVEACTGSKTDKEIHKAISLILDATQYSEDLEEVVESKNAGIGRCKNLVVSVRSPNEAAELRGQVSRYLESSPDHPGLLMLRALSEALSRDKDTEVVRENFRASVSFALSSYGLNESSVFEFAAWAASFVSVHSRESARDLVLYLVQTYPSRHLAKKLIEHLPFALSGIPAWFLLSGLQRDCESLIIKEED